MKSVDIFATGLKSVVQDKHVQHYGAILLSQGVKGVARANPAVVWLDAAIAVIEATGTWCRYSSEREITQQLRIQNEVLEATLKQQWQIDELELTALREESQQRRKAIQHLLSEKKVHFSISFNKIRTQLESLKRLQYLLQNERMQMGNFNELINLQVCLDSCIDATLALLLNPVGETP
ncbi:hypothetical protein [Serratia fonticola]|uniref:hypothetical protein n=1 Tax=Serratia fonticola TaxID=47917 RepID=UPI0021771ED1|nr:hypothetical protein [Serratia fonticola]CAI1210186.1 Uncharacterised protein [Serratia fonticola]